MSAGWGRSSAGPTVGFCCAGKDSRAYQNIGSDATGGGKNDLVLLVHDRIILYPQD